MSKGRNRRKRLFDVFSENLEFLKKHKKFKKYKFTGNQKYICPICLDPFTENDLEETSVNRLTLEDAPPKSLKGSQIALTCAVCNNGMGKDIDWHLTERFYELDFKDKINGAIQVYKNGVTKAFHSKKNNNPKLLQ